MIASITAATEIERELSPGEHVLWSGQPQAGLRLRAADAFLIPFTCLWAGFAVFWETGVITSGAPFFFMLWGIPFLVVGAYITVGRFFVDAAIRGKTVYGVTNERVLLISSFMNRTVKSLPLHTLPELELEQRGDGRGTITFGPSMPFATWYRGFAWPGMGQRTPPAFDMIPDAKAVYDRIRHAQRAAVTRTTA
ncbi:hypothetical protein K2Z83_02845 [Oscillochloris sp. ZM17-4]|uniref:hypothetical protein n=1 Tax=Oscillochloris sp. ZM17-4 TaxID=2866714 RepID=UPI001C73BFF2|nr:hypothetical protein [Oscillochloris sp. ZM17-4]MBX0326619.1 hypothetical protein [Oscillochloris sp. ZM17-4]